MPELILAAAQTIPEKENIQSNILQHIDLIELAANKGAQLIHFPELSLTGYEPELAKELTFEIDDQRLKPLQKIAASKKIIVIAGAPLSMGDGIQIASFILHPNNSQELYTKHFLHPGEEKYFIPGKENPQLQLGNLYASCSICADITHTRHIQSAAETGSNIYLPGVFITHAGYTKDVGVLSENARRTGMLVLMANFGGPSGNFESAGKSACWDNSGKMIAQLATEGKGIVLAKYWNKTWSAESYSK